jgi:hypothetical protein
LVVVLEGDVTCARRSIGVESTSALARLRKAILDLHRDDLLRRTYIRRWWIEPTAPTSRATANDCGECNFDEPNLGPSGLQATRGRR